MLLSVHDFNARQSGPGFWVLDTGGSVWVAVAVTSVQPAPRSAVRGAVLAAAVRAVSTARAAAVSPILCPGPPTTACLARSGVQAATLLSPLSII